MSGITGVWDFDGERVEHRVLQEMSRRLSHRGPDGEGMWFDKGVGLACQNNWVTPESEKETQPVIGYSGAVLVFDGRLDNREDILARLDGSDGVSESSSDALLILSAYHRAGEHLPEWLAGDFALAIYDPRERRLLLARDALGVRPLYYCQVGPIFLFASEVKAILAHPHVVTLPNDDVLADFLFDRMHDTGRTFFQGISALPPAHVMIVTPGGNVKRQYWDFDPTREIRFKSFDDYAEAYRERFVQAVRRRLRTKGPVAISASGGVDSSSILCAAEQMVRTRNCQAPSLFGISYLSAERTPSDEQHFLVEIEKSYGTDIIKIPPGPMKILAGSRTGVQCIEAPFVDEQWGNSERTLQEAQQRGARVLLTGHWGDQFLFSQAYLVDLIRRLRWITVGTHLREYRRWLTDTDPKWFYNRLFVDLVMEYLPARIVPFLRRMRRGRRSPWYSKSFQRLARQRLHERPARSGHCPTAYINSIYATARAGYYVFCMEWDNKLGNSYGLDMAFPFLDRDLIQFMMAIPGDVQADQGVPKALIRRAMRGVVPEPILGRKWKADYTHVVNEGMAGEYLELIDCLESSGRAIEWGYLEKSVLRETLSPLREQLQRTDCQAAWQLSDLLGLELWLQAFFDSTPPRGFSMNS